jgi:D-glycero-D-manno-heptose 1,7-bisphosphate phosphatase
MTQQTKLAVLDKDGTLVVPKSGDKFINSPEDQILIPNVIDRLKYLQSQGYRLAIASNQGGVEMGHKTLNNALLEIRFCVELLHDAGIVIDRAMLCPDYKGEICYIVDLANKQYRKIDKDTDNNTLECIYDIKSLEKTYRKPHGGMLKLASKYPNEYRIMIGDRAEDQGAAMAANFDEYVNAGKWHSEEISFF